MTISALDLTNRLDECRERHEDEYLIRAQKIIDKYRAEQSRYNSRARRSNSGERAGSGKTTPKVSMLFSNTETLTPAMYSSMPLPVAQRTHYQDNPIARQGSEVIERALSQSMDNGRNDFDELASMFVEDYLLPGRSVDRVLYSPAEKDGEVVFEELVWHHVPWMWFAYDPQSRWEDVDWLGYGDHFFKREELKKKFKLTEAEVQGIPVQKDVKSQEEIDIQVWEIWDKVEKKVFWHVHGYDKILKTEDPPVKLMNFFDCPKPLYSIPTNDSLIPIPEYVMYQYQAEEINDLTKRIDHLIDAIRANGMYAGDQKAELDNLLKSQDGVLIPVSDWAAIIERGGIDGMITWVPIEQFAKVLQILTAQRQLLIQQIHDQTGISDLMRGTTDPRETKGAQQLKANFGAQRIQPRQREIQKYIRNLLRIAAEIIVENFDRATVEDMTGLTIEDATWQLLRDDADRVYNIDIETDSTIAIDDQQEKQAVGEFMNAMANFLPVAQQLAASGGEQGAKISGTIILWAMRRFRAGGEVEEAVEEFLRNPPPPPPPQPDPAMVKAQQDMQMKQADMQIKQAESQQDMQIQMQEFIQEMQMKQAELEIKLEEIRKLGNAKVETENARTRAVTQNANKQDRPNA